MKTTPAQLDRIITAVRQHNSPLPWEPDVNKANEKIFELWTVLKLSLRCLGEYEHCVVDIENMTSIGQRINGALALVQKVEVEK